MKLVIYIYIEWRPFSYRKNQFQINRRCLQILSQYSRNIAYQNIALQTRFTKIRVAAKLVSTKRLGSSWNAAFYGKLTTCTYRIKLVGEGKSNQSREIHVVIYSYRSNIPKTSHLMDGRERYMRGRNSYLKRFQFIRVNYSILRSNRIY